MIEQAKLFFSLYYKPLAAMSRIIDQGHWFFGAFAVLAINLVMQVAMTVPLVRPNRQPPPDVRQQPQLIAEAVEADEVAEEAVEMAAGNPSAYTMISAYALQFLSPFSGWLTGLAVALLYVPATILCLSLAENIGSFGVAFRRDYGALLACTLLAWAAVHLPLLPVYLAVTAAHRSPLVLYAFSLLAKFYFAFLMVCALRRVFGARFSRAIAVVCVSWVAMFLQPMLWILASPCLLMYLWFYMRGEAAGLGAAFSSRQSFRRNLEAATINPKDSEAHYQLGLIYQQRFQYDKAVHHFQQAVAVNHRETDAHYQLGSIARRQGRLPEAISHFSEVVAQDDNHAHGEIWREIGATYAAAAMYDDARTALETFVERRPYDPEGLFHLGVVLQKSARIEEAEARFTRCVESAKTKLYDRGGQSRQWGKQAEKQLRSIRQAAPAT